MAMDAKDYEFLVYRLEADSRNNPHRFRLKVAVISGLAYAVLLLFLLTLAAIAYLLVAEARSSHQTFNLVRIGLFAATLIPIFWVTIRAFLTRIDPPDGREITRSEAPKLFAILDRIRATLQAPPLDKVIVDEQYNAAICQVPRLGLFGAHRNYLILGLPYLLGTPKQEAIATLAHEYGHLAGNHGKMGAWVYRQRRTFGAIHAKVAADAEANIVNAMIAGALNLFAPYFNAYTFVLSRQQEYEADMAASQIAGGEANASGLVRDQLLGAWIAETFWPRLYAQADTAERPRFLPYASMRTAFAAAHGEWADAARLRTALKKDSGLEDTHPCLRERLEAIDGKAVLPAAPARTAADSFLGPALKGLIDEFDRHWWEANRSRWQSHHRQQAEAGRRLAELSNRPLESLDTFELQEFGSLQAQRGELDTALHALRHLTQRAGGPYPRADLLIARILLARDDRSGLDYLNAARQADASLQNECLSLGYGYLSEREGVDAAEAWVNRIVSAH